MGQDSTISVPKWVVVMFTALQPIIASGIVAGVGFIFSLNQQVVILNVKMEQTLNGQIHVRELDHDLTDLKMRLARIEALASEKVGAAAAQ